MNRKFYIFFIVKRLSPFLFLILLGCKSDPPDSQSNYSTYKENSEGNYTLSGEGTIVIKNFLGPLIVNGEISAHPSVRWFIDKNVQAESEEEANKIFPLINPDIQKQGDTIFLTLNAAIAAAIECGLEIDIPVKMVCRIDHVLGNSSVSYMDSLLIVQSASNVAVSNHSGSSEISLNSGNISVETALQEDEFCKVNINTGNISIKIPVNTSVEVYAKSNAGNVSNSGLTFTTIRQTNNSINGTLGEGDGEIRAETKAGNIILQVL